MTPYLNRPLRSELQARLDLELKALSNLSDEEMLAHALWMADHLKEVLETVRGNAKHDDTRQAADWAVEYVPDLAQPLQDCRASWINDPQGMQDEIDEEELLASQAMTKKQEAGK